MAKQGDIYWVNLEPAEGVETKKLRPCLVLNSTSHINKLRIVAPLLKWKSFHGASPFFIPISPSPQNKLDTIRTPDVFQMRAVDLTRRFKGKQGSLDQESLQKVLVAARLLFS